MNDIGQHATGIFIRVVFNAMVVLNLTEGATVRTLRVPQIDTLIISSI
jgi:hypothetical protein